jgi:hypothetical protein
VRTTSTKVTLLASLLFLAACGNGGDGAPGDRAAFDAYEARVDPLLAEEEGLRAEWDQGFEAAATLGGNEVLAEVVRDVLLPGYEDLARRAGEVRPEESRLRALHGRFVRYLSDRVELCKVFLDAAGRAAGPEERLTRHMREVGEAQEGVEARAAEIDRLVKRAVEEEGDGSLANLMNATLMGDVILLKNPNLFDLVGEYMAGRIRTEDPTAVLLEALRSKADPYFEELGERIAKAEEAAETEKIREVLQAARDYREAALDYLGAVRRFATVLQEISPFVQREVAPLFEKFREGMEGTGRDLADYRSIARAYRSSLGS